MRKFATYSLLNALVNVTQGITKELVLLLCFFFNAMVNQQKKKVLTLLTKALYSRMCVYLLKTSNSTRFI